MSLSYKKGDCSKIGEGHVFEIPSTLSPPRDIFNIGDIIIISADFGDKVCEKNTGKSYLLSGWNFARVTSMYRADTIYPEGELIDGLPSFEVEIPEQFN